MTARREREPVDAARLALEAAGLGVWDERLSSGRIHWSARCRRIFGAAPDEEIDFDRFLSLVHPEDRQRAQVRFQEAMRPGPPRTFVFRVTPPEGGARWVQLSVLAVPAGGDTRLVAAVADATEDRWSSGRAEALTHLSEYRLRARTADAELLGTELDTFADTAAHDLRGPLRRIAAYVQSVLDDGAQAPASRGRLEAVVASCRRMNVLLDDLLSLTRSARREIAFETVDLSRLSEDAARELAAASPGRRVEFQAQPGLVARGDRVLLRTALRCLLDNAWKFSAARPVAHVAFAAARHGRETVYRVEDDGAGFDMEYAGKMFRPFERIHPAGEFSGDGVGLAIVERAIRRHRGRVWAHGRPGAGAAFYFTLFTEKR